MLIALVIALISLVALMVIHEFGHFIIAKKFGVKVEEFGIGYPPRLFGKKFGETLYSINLLPLGAFVRIYGEENGIDDYRSFSKLAIWKRMLIVLGGVLAFWVAAFVIFSIAFGIGAKVPIGDQNVPGTANPKIIIIGVSNDSPAEAAGLASGDELMGFAKVADFQKFISENKSKQVMFSIQRDGKIINASLVPRETYPENQGPTGVVLERTATVIEKYPWYQAPLQGAIYTGKTTWQALQGIYGFFASIFGGKGVPSGAEVAGPVGITIFLAKAADFGVGFFLYFIGSLSVLVAIFNLFPIPALDGGKVVFLLIEKAIGKPVPSNWEQGITAFFFIALITMSLFITIRFDVPRVIDLWRASL